jgi:hypothetical protein
MSTINRNPGGNTVELSAIDADWTWSDTFKESKYENGIRINFIQFNTAAAADVCIIKDGSATGPKIFKATGHTIELVREKTVYYGGARMKPFLDEGDGAYNAAATVIINIINDI